MVSLRTLALFYKRHWRVQPLRELMAVLGIAAGVALLFAVQVTNKSVTGSFEQLAQDVAGKATIEVVARAPQGFNQDIFRRVSNLSDVESAAPILERRIAVKGPEGRRALTLIGADDRVTQLGGRLLTRFSRRGGELSDLGIQLTEPTATAIGVRTGDTVTVLVGERIRRLRLAGIVSKKDVGPLVQSPVAAAPLGLAQELAAMPERITRILVVPQRGREAQATATLTNLANSRLNVRRIHTEARLLGDAANAERQLTVIFSAISLVVGILLAYNAMLLAMVERRAFIAYLRQFGSSDLTIVASLVFDALILGLAGSVLGIFLGDLLSRYVFHQIPSYLASAFAIGSQRVIGIDTMALALGGGIFAALAAATQPAISLYQASTLKATTTAGSLRIERENARTTVRLFRIGLLLIIATAALSLFIPATIIVGMGALVIGLVLVLPAVVTKALRGARKVSRRLSDPAARLSIAELIATPMRSIALAATGALATFAILSISGSTSDLQRGGRGLTGDALSNADLWVRTGGDENVYDTEPFNYRKAATRIKSLPIVESARAYRESFLDLPDRRLWVVGVPRKDQHLIAPSQIVKGDFAVAQRRLRQGGWAALTSTVAEELDLRLGQAFTLPTPSGKSHFRLAATISHYGWFSGTVAINADDYRSRWKTTQASQLAVRLTPDVPLSQGKAQVQRVLGTDSALTVQTADERRETVDDTVSQGLARLNQISDIVLFVAVISVVAVMLAAIWQRRERLDSLVSIGMGPWQLARMVFLETGLILLVGCVIGMTFGLLGQPLVDKWLHDTTGAPVPFIPAWQLGIRTIALAGLLSALAAVVAVKLTVRFEPKAAFSAEESG